MRSEAGRTLLRNCRLFDGRNILDGLRDILISDGRIVEISVRPIAGVR